jgi:ribonuclease P protein component
VPTFSFKKTQRLLNTSDYKQVFDHNRVKVANSSLLILAKPTDGCPSRLGLVIAKKNIPTAVQRNRIKRVARETFRKKQFQGSLDVVFLARQGADKLSTEKLTAIIEKSWAKLDSRCKMLEPQSA